MNKDCKGFVAVHVGAGYHSPANSELYEEVCKNACYKALEALKQNRCALDAVTIATMALEDSPWTNAGTGSNLTITGQVECDASVMDGDSLHYGAVGAVSGVKNPVCLAENLLKTQMQGAMSLGRIPPSILVGPGAREWAKKNNIPVATQQDLLTDGSKRAFIKHKRKLDLLDEGHEMNKRVHRTQPSNSRGDATTDGHFDHMTHQSSDPHTTLSRAIGQINPTNTVGQRHDQLLDTVKQRGDQLLDAVKQRSDQLLDTVTQKHDQLLDTVKQRGDQLLDTVGQRGDQLLDAVKQRGDQLLDTVKQRDDQLLNTVGQRDDQLLDTVGQRGDQLLDTVKQRDDQLLDTVGQRDDQLLDTVGAVCVDGEGRVASAVSSGGIVLKQSGRLGQAALYGCGCWAECDKVKKTGLGISTSGCGEHLTKTLIARKCAECLQHSDNPALGLAQTFQHQFLDSAFLQTLDQKLGGALAVVSDCSQENLKVEVMWVHTTDSMGLAYMSTADQQPTTFISRLPKGQQCGKSYIVQSKCVSIPAQ